MVIYEKHKQKLSLMLALVLLFQIIGPMLPINSYAEGVEGVEVGEIIAEEGEVPEEVETTEEAVEVPEEPVVDRDQNLQITTDEELIGVPDLGFVATSAPKDLGKIFKNPKVTVNDTTLTDGSVIDIKDGMEVKIHYDWELPDDEGDFNLVEGDFAITKLPEVLNASKPEAGGALYDGNGDVVGSYIFDGGNLKVVFNDKLVGQKGRKGDAWFLAKFNLTEFEENVIQEIEFEEPFDPISIRVNPSEKLGILAKRVKLNADINATKIYWEIDVNSSLDSLTNATLEDIIPDGLKLENGSIKVYNLAVGYKGNLTEGAITTFIGEATEKGFKVEFGKIDTAYRVKYTTTIEDYSKAPYTNKAVLNDGDTEKGKASATVDKIVTGSSIEKSGLAYKGSNKSSHNSTKITWTIDVNKSESNISNAVVDDDITDTRLTVDNGSIKVYYLNKVGSEWKQGNEVEGLDTSKFPITLGDTNGMAYSIVFDTDIDYGDSYAPSTIFENTATLTGDNIEGGNSPAEVNVTRGTLIEKDGAEATSYDNPNIKWTIHVNRAEQKLTNAVVKDTIGTGLKYRNDSLKVFDNNTFIDPSKYNEKGISVDTSTNPITVNLGNIANYYKIEYVTDIVTLGQVGGYKNGLELTADSGLGSGIGQGYTNAEKTVKPNMTNKYTKNTINNGIDYTDKTMSWNIKIEPIKEKITSLTITDTFTNNGLVFLEDTLRVTKGTGSSEVVVDGSTYKLTDNKASGFVLVFNGELERVEYNIYFKTSFDPDILKANSGTLNKEKKYINNANFTGTTVDKDGKETNIDTDAYVDYTINDVAFNAGKKEGTLNRDGRNITWKVYVNYLSQDFTEKAFVVEDILGETEQILNFGSIVVKEFSVGSGGNISEVNEAVIPKYELVETNTEDGKKGFILTFENSIEKPYVIEFTTNITGVSKSEYNNIATVTVDETVRKYPASTGQYIAYDTFIEKSAVNVSGNQVYTDDTINWKVQINKSLSEIKEVVFTDTIGNGLVYVIDSLKVFDKDNKELATDKYKLNVAEKEDGTTVLTVELGNIDSVYTITYDTVVIATTGKVSNQASISSKDFVENKTKKVEFYSTKTSGGSGSGVNNRGSITIKKVDSEDRLTTLDAIFELYYLLNGKEQIVNGQQITTTSGQYKFEGLTLRTYFLREVVAPAGYALLDEEIEIILSSEKDKNDIEIEVKNTKIKRDIEFIKYGEGDYLLQGAEFELYIDKGEETDFDNPVKEATSDVDGKVLFTDVEYGNYIIRETKAPEGYNLSEVELKVTITENGEPIDPTDKDGMANTKIRGNIEFTKYGEDNNPLEGATFTLYEANDAEFKNPIKSVISDSTGKVEFNDVEYGSYIIKETKAPLGYNKNAIELEVSITVDGETINPIKEGLENTRIRGSLEIFKVARGTEKPLKGASFALYSKDGTLIDEKTTDEKGEVVFEELVYGDYYFIETKAPSGYIKNDEQVELSIVENEVTVELTIENRAISDKSDPEGRIRIIKKDSETRELLSGAEFDIIDSKGKVVDTLTTNSKGEAVSIKLPVGWYTIEETEAPEGYELSVEVVDKKVSDGVTLEVVIYNEKIEPEIPVKPVEPVKPVTPTTPIEPSNPGNPEVPGGDNPDEFENVDGNIPEGTTSGQPEKPTSGQSDKSTLPKTGQSSSLIIMIIGLGLVVAGIFLKRKAVK